MTARGSSAVIQTASTEFVVGADGVMQARAAGQVSTIGVAPPANGSATTLSVALAEKAAALSSDLSDDAFYHLTSIRLTSDTGATMRLMVLGFVREAATAPCERGAMQIITHIGRVIVRGSALHYVDDVQAALFAAHGFTSADAAAPPARGGTARRLQVRELFGLFNAIVANARLVPLGGVCTPAERARLPPTLPSHFVMFARRRAPCVPIPANDSTPVSAQPAYSGTGPLPAGPGVDVCAALRIPASQLLVTPSGERFVVMTVTTYRAGDARLRTEYTHPLAPNQTLVEVLDASDADAPIQFQYQAQGATRGIGMMSPADAKRLLNLTVSAPIPAPVGPFFFYKEVNVTKADLVAEALGSPMDYLGNTTIAGEPVSIWAVHLHNNSFHAYWYSAISDRFPRRISFAGFGDLDVLRLNELPTEPQATAHLFQTPLRGFTYVQYDDSPDTVARRNASFLAGEEAPAALPARVTLNPLQPFLDTFAGRVAAERRLAAAKRGAVVHEDVVAAWTANMTAQLAAASGGRAGAAARELQLGSSVMCSAANLCPARANLLCGNSCNPSTFNTQVVQAAIGPVSFIVGPVNRVPCMYQLALAVPWTLVPVLNMFELEGAVQIQLCNDLSGFSVAQGSITLTFDALASLNLQEPAASLNPFTYRIASLTVGVYSSGGTGFLKPTGTLSGGTLSLTGDGSAQLLQNIRSVLGESAARAALHCFNRKLGAVQLGAIVGGPDIPGFAIQFLVTAIPPLAAITTPLLPFLAMTKFTNQISYYYTPAACGNLARTDFAATVALELNLVFFSDSLTILNPQFSRCVPVCVTAACARARSPQPVTRARTHLPRCAACPPPLPPPLPPSLLLFPLSLDWYTGGHVGDYLNPGLYGTDAVMALTSQLRSLVDKLLHQS